MVSDLHVARQTALMLCLVLLWLVLEERSRPLVNVNVNIPMNELELIESSDDD